MITKLVIRLIRDTAKVLSSHRSDEDHTFEQHIDLILKLKSPLRVKPKGRSPGTKNKKSSQTEAGLDDSTRRELSRLSMKKERIRAKTPWSKSRIYAKDRGKVKEENVILVVVKVKGGGKGKARACASEIPSVDFEEEEESDLIIDARSSKIDQGSIRSVGMSTRNILRK